MMAVWISFQADPTLEELMRCKRCKQPGYFPKEASTYIYLYLLIFRAEFLENLP